MSLTGDFQGLRKLIDRLRLAVAGGLKERLSQELAANARKLIADEFRGERDPYGVPWKDLKHRTGGSILRDTGYMAGHVGAYPTSSGFRVNFLAPYAKVHQTGGWVKPHTRRGGALPVGKSGRFISRARAGRNKRFTNVRAYNAYQVKGYAIPRRALLPSASWGGLGPIWTKAFMKTTNRVLREQLGKSAAGGEG